MSGSQLPLALSMKIISFLNPEEAERCCVLIKQKMHPLTRDLHFWNQHAPELAADVALLYEAENKSEKEIIPEKC